MTARCMRLVPLFAALLLTLLPAGASAQGEEAESHTFTLMTTPYAGVFLEHLERAEGYSRANEPFLALAQLRSMMAAMPGALRDEQALEMSQRTLLSIRPPRQEPGWLAFGIPLIASVPLGLIGLALMGAQQGGTPTTTVDPFWEADTYAVATGIVLAGVLGLALVLTGLVRMNGSASRRSYLQERMQMLREMRTLHRHGYFPDA